jgi:hypothetical protein
MKILVSLMSGANNTERTVLRSFYEGLVRYYSEQYGVSDEVQLKEAADIELELNYDQEVPPCDIGIQFGTVKDRSADHHVTKQSLLKNAGTIVYIETPILGRVINDKNNYNYYRVGVNGYLNNQGTFYLDDTLDTTRFKKLVESNHVKPFPGWKKTSDGAILILCQLPGDSSLRGQKMSEWLIDTITDIRAETERPIIVRLHPAMSIKARAEFLGEVGGILFRNYPNISWSSGTATTLDEDLKKSGICVTYSSGSAVDAILAGVPVIALDEGNFAWPISSRTLGELSAPWRADRKIVDDWLMKLANCQWNRAEMSSGYVWRHLEPIIERVIS